jgi:hypothetical protein
MAFLDGPTGLARPFAFDLATIAAADVLATDEFREPRPIAADSCFALGMRES